MVSKRIKFNFLALFLGSSVASLAFSIGCSFPYYFGIFGGIVGSSLGGLICGIFIFKRDWKFIGPSNIILILVFAIITARFASSGFIWNNIWNKYDPSLLLVVLGAIVLLTAFGTMLGYRIKLGLKSYLRKRETISQEVSPITKKRQDFLLYAGILFIVSAAFFLFDFPHIFIFGDVSAYIGTILMLFAAVYLARSIIELASNISGLEKKIKRTYVMIILWGGFFAISRMFTTDIIMIRISAYVVLPFMILLALIQMVTFISHYQVMKEQKKTENLVDRLTLYLPLIYSPFAILKVIMIALLIANLYRPGYIFEITLNYIESVLFIALGTLFIIESKKHTPSKMRKI